MQETQSWTKEPTKASLQQPPSIQVNLCCSPLPSSARTTDATTTILGCRASLARLKTIRDPHCPQMQADVKARAATARLEIEQLLVEAPASFEDIERQASAPPQT